MVCQPPAARPAADRCQCSGCLRGGHTESDHHWCPSRPQLPPRRPVPRLRSNPRLSNPVYAPTDRLDGWLIASTMLAIIALGAAAVASILRRMACP